MKGGGFVLQFDAHNDFFVLCSMPKKGTRHIKREGKDRPEIAIG